MDYCRRKTVGGVVDIIMVVVAAAAAAGRCTLTGPRACPFLRGNEFLRSTCRCWCCHHTTAAANGYVGSWLPPAAQVPAAAQATGVSMQRALEQR